MIRKDEWRRLWLGVCELEDEFEGRLVFIGGVAVYLHVRRAQLSERFVEFSHDGDFSISLSDFGVLRDTDDVTKNLRLRKYQIVRHDAEFDVYLERQSGLVVPFRALYAASTVIDRVRVASLEHLLALKLEAYRDRRRSTKGSKDERDIVRVVYLLSRGVYGDLLFYLPKASLELLAEVDRSHAFMQIAGGNAHEARKIRERFRKVVSLIGESLR